MENIGHMESLENKDEIVDLGSSDFWASIFNWNNFTFLLWFLAIYLLFYFGLRMFGSGDPINFQSGLSRTLDILFLVIIVAVLSITYFSYTETEKEGLLSNFSKSIIDFINTPSSVFTVALCLVLFYFLTYLFGIPMESSNKPFFVALFENIIWILLVIILIVDFFLYVLGISLKNLFDGIDLFPIEEPEPEPAPAPVPAPPKETNEVFNIANNLYTYEDAQAICTSYGAKLATYDQIEAAYGRGAEWCNYGWSDGQMIFFPTQKSTWQKLQANPAHKNDCGRPGINGGYIANPYVKFGVNCYGKKPKPSADDLARLGAKKDVVYPKSPQDVELDAKIKHWKENADKLLQINSYNNAKWSEW